MIIFTYIKEITMNKAQTTKVKNQKSDLPWLNNIMPASILKKLRAKKHKRLETDLDKHHLRII